MAGQTNNPEVFVQMLIRKPVTEVFEAFINPEITTKFWFTKSSGKLVEGASILWEWEMYAASTVVEVIKVIPNQLIRISWDEPSTFVDFVFQAEEEQATLVCVKNYGFPSEENALIAKLMDATGGFTTVLDGLKAWLEWGIDLGLIKDKFLYKYKG